MDTYFRGGQLQGEQWYPIKINHVDRMAVMDKSKVKIQDDACEAISRENNVKIMKLVWLSKLNPDKLHSSLVVYLSIKEEADKLLS